MNLILFTRDELDREFEPDDQRVVHVMEVLKFGPDDWFDIGVVNGPRGKARMTHGESGRVRFEFRLGEEPPDLHPVTLILGVPRPQTARKLLRELTSLGVGRLWFAMTDRSEKGYAASRLWTTGEFERHLRQGAEQAFCTRIPEMRRFGSLDAALDALSASSSNPTNRAGTAGPAVGPGSPNRLALDNYESSLRLSDWTPRDGSMVLAIGAERGWSAAERAQLRDRGFELAQLGDRVLRVETAAVAAVAVLLAKRGLI